MDKVALADLSSRIQRSISEINKIEQEIQDGIDISIKKRDSYSRKANNEANSRKATMRFVCRRLEDALGEIHKAQDKLDNNIVEFSL